MTDTVQGPPRCKSCGCEARVPCICANQNELLTFLLHFQPQGRGRHHPPPATTASDTAPLGVIGHESRGGPSLAGTFRTGLRAVTVTIAISVGILGALLASGNWIPGPLFSPTSPSLPPLLAAPGPGYLAEEGGALSGYVSPATVEAAIGTPAIPGGVKAYARTWVRMDLRSSVVEAAILTRSADEAVRTVALLLSICHTRSGRPILISSLAGDAAGGCAVASITPPDTAPGFYAAVARSRMAVLVMVSAPGEPGARDLGTGLIQATAALVAPDPLVTPASALPDTFSLSTGIGSPWFDQRLGGLLVAIVVLTGLRFAINRGILRFQRACPSPPIPLVVQFLRRRTPPTPGTAGPTQFVGMGRRCLREDVRGR